MVITITIIPIDIIRDSQAIVSIAAYHNAKNIYSRP